MDFMTFVVIVLIIVVIVLLSTLKSEAKKNAITLNKHIVAVYKKVNALEKKLQDGTVEVSKKVVASSKSAADKVIQEVKPVQSKPNVVVDPVVEKPKEVIKNPLVTPIVESKKTESLEKEINKKVEPIKIQSPTPEFKPKAPAPKKDWEKLIGENLLNKIGIAVLVIGIGFFVKYAIDQNWIGEFGRVAIGIGVGVSLVVLAHFMRKNYSAFSSVLIGGGIGVWYYTISIAYHEYAIFSQPVAFVIMTLITITSVILSVIYDKKEIAIIGMIGGFTSPFMIKGEDENYMAFFSYIAILNGGMLALSFFKKWNVINKLAYGFTILFFGGWIITSFIDHNLDRKFLLLMGSIYYIQFLGMSLFYNIKHKLKFNALEFIQILSVNALYFTIGMVALYNYQDGAYQGLFALCLAGFNGVIFFALKGLKSLDQNLPVLFLGKTVSFVTLAILMQFDAHYATLFWAIEAIVLLFLAQKSKHQLLRSSSVIVTGIATLGLIYSWFHQYQDFDKELVFDSPFISQLGIVGTYLVSLFLLSKEEESSQFFSIPVRFYRNSFGFWAFVAFYVTVLIKIVIQLDNYPMPYESDVMIWGYNLLMFGAGLTFCKFRKVPMFTEAFAMLTIFAIAAYLVVGNVNTISLRNYVLNYDLNQSHLFLHFILVAIICFLFFVIRRVSFQISDNKSFHKWILVILSVFGVTLASMELDHIAVSLFYEKGVTNISSIIRQTQFGGYTTLWAIYSFILIAYGMRQKNAHMRILALVIFAVTLLKLFIFDFQHISKGGKIVTFISLGVILLAVSFLYQRLKNMLTDEEKIVESNEEG